jgi:hypothetical protein
MTGQDIINNAKLIYSVDTFIPEEDFVLFLNQAREKVNKFAKLTYGEYSFDTVKDQWQYTLTNKFYEIYRAKVKFGDVVISLEPALSGEFPLREKLKSIPVQFAFIPLNKLTLYPCPDSVYTVFLYGYIPLTFNYTLLNLRTEDVIPEAYFEAISFDIARRIAMYDQNYELMVLFKNEFFEQLKQMKI